MADDRERRTLRALTSLLDDGHLAASESLPRIVQSAAAQLGWAASVYLIDYEQLHLIQMPSEPGAPVNTERVDGTMAGRAFSSIKSLPAVGPNGRPRLWVPLLDGVDRLGVLDIHLDGEHDHDEVRDQVRWFAHLVGHLIGSKSPYGDIIQQTRLTRRRSVESELIWSMLPPLTVACHGLVISGLLEPAHAVAGDVFDYAVSQALAQFGIVDATGHDLQSGVIGATALAAYRNSRRAADGLAQTARTIDDSLARLGLDTFATGVFAKLELTSGVLRYVNAGHPAPLLVRGGHVVKSLEGGRRPLLGLPAPPADEGVEQLERQDWLVLYTDGVTEARDAARRFFGLDRFVDVIERCVASQLSAPEALRRMVHEIMEHQHGVLQDDATIVVVQWSAGGEQELSA